MAENENPEAAAPAPSEQPAQEQPAQERPAWAAVRGAVVALVDVVDVAVAVVVDRAPDADAVRPVARAAVRDAATMLADGAGLVADAAAMARAVAGVTAAAGTADVVASARAASWSRT